MTTRSLLTAAAVGCAFASTSLLSAQTGEAPATPLRHARWELVLPAGTIVPTGTQRDAIKRGDVTAAQLSYVVRPSLAVTATLGWARSRDIASVGDPKLDLFTYDVGAEVRAPRWIGGEAMAFTPFAGIGAGARSYNYRTLDVDATHNVAGYGAVGGELAVRRVHLRVEARDYVTGFKPLRGAGAATSRNDVTVMAGLRFTRR